VTEPTFFDSPAALRKWLEKKHATQTELFVGLHKRHTGKGALTWSEMVDQLLCFGWIDGVARRIDNERWMIRVTPRRRGSNWSAVNIKKVAELTRLGLMAPSGLKAFEERPQSNAYSYEQRRQELAGDYLFRLKSSATAWDFFKAQPPGYRATASYWVMSAKREETRQKRLGTLIADSEAGVRIDAITSPGRRQRK
jgi:uncharacterized protein YdeI (YjbR/CyaY-like superfamily)